ncbi:MAG TPA: glycine cleavage system protein GcvH [Caldisericia bacterium]|nr:MAG: Glycine cleavage system H protein [bacterium ADurb.Bin132]HNW32081.1 glycine cleavage system protein GcvH [Caldisericia bacterium]HNY61703.1 glycine cleavage system protein GcvH [Caldisericia bacterium]HOC80037.1 glycine cleavage system protein GcvH [Caldisericia bacterium]HOG70703.1 glycine cleavage system protein GcvH [Caldisericia bacterium]
MKVYYTKTDEYVKVDGDTAIVGITEYAQHHLGDIIFVDKIAVGKQVKKEGILTAIESVKAATDVFSPVSGEITEFNENVSKTPAIINQSAEGDGWIAKIKLANPGEVNSLLSPEDYSKIHAE